MVWNLDSSIYQILARLSEADILRSLVGKSIQIAVETQETIAGESSHDLLLGGPENDLLIGDIGNDTIYGGAGNNTLLGGTGHLIVVDWEGQDFLVGGSGNDLIFGNQADDTLYGGDGDDTLYGGKDRDFLSGNGGNDVLFGDLGSDTLWGGEGQNRFQIGRRFAVPGFLSTGGPTLADADWIMDFTPGQDFIGLLGGLSFDELNIFAGTGENAGDTIIQDTITQEYLAIVKNIAPEAIVRDNFWPTSQPSLPSVPPRNPPINPPVPVEDTSPVQEQVSPVQIALNHPSVVTLPEQPKPDSIIFPDHNLSETEQEEPSDFQPDVPPETETKIEIEIETEQEEPSDSQPDVPPETETEQEEPSDLQPDVPLETETKIEIEIETEQEEPSDLQPDVPLETKQEEPSDLQPDVLSEIEQEEPSDLQPDVVSKTETKIEIETETEESSDLLQPDVPPETEEEEPSDLQPDVPPETEIEIETETETEEEEPSDLLEPDVPPETETETEEEEPSDLLEPDVPPETEEEETSDLLEPDVPPETEEEETSDLLEPDVPPETETEEEEEEPSDLLEPDVPPETETEEEEEDADEPIPDEDETPPIEDEQGDDNSGEIEDEPLDDDGENSSGDDGQISVTVNYSDARSGIIANLSEGSVTRLFTTDEDVPFKILPLGDSNTRGFPNQASIGGYRTRLWERLVEDNGFNIDFVGQAKSGPGDIDRDHEGRGGFTITELIDNSEKFSGYNQPKAPLYTTIEDVLNYAQPDAVLLMAGTNDILQNKPVETALTDLGILVDRIVASMPDTQVLVSSIIPHTSSNATRQQRTTEFSEQVEEIVVAPRANTNPNIRFVDMFNLPFVAGDYANDGIHLKASGYDKLADEWYSEIRMLPSGEETLTDVQNIIGSAYDDTLIGDNQSNVIRGGEGNDWLLGGGGEDTFILASGEGTNTIADFETGIDRIGLSDGLEFEQLLISPGSDANQTQIAIADTGESLAILLDIDSSMINADDFLLV